MDPRSTATRDRLNEVVLELAQRRNPEDIPVSELAARAGISRVTFYDHHKSVGALLVSALTGELDVIRELSRSARGTTLPVGAHLPEISIVRVAEHVRSHRDLYEFALLESSSATVERALRRHFEASLLELPAPHRLPDGVSHAAAVRYTAYGMVGAISGWLEAARGSTLGDAELVGVIERLQPDWWR